MEKLEYSGLLVLFFVPTFWILIKRYGKETKKLTKLILAMAFFGVVGFLITIPLGAYWGAWGYDLQKTWGIHIGADLLETFLWSIAGCIVLAIVVGVFAEREEKKKPFWPFL